MRKAHYGSAIMQKTGWISGMKPFLRYLGYLKMQYPNGREPLEIALFQNHKRRPFFISWKIVAESWDCETRHQCRIWICALWVQILVRPCAGSGCETWNWMIYARETRECGLVDFWITGLLFWIQEEPKWEYRAVNEPILSSGVPPSWWLLRCRQDASVPYVNDSPTFICQQNNLKVT